MSTKKIIYRFILNSHNTILIFLDEILLILLFCLAVICFSIIYMNVQNCSKRSIAGIEYMLYQFCSAYHNSFCIVSYNIIIIKLFCFWNRIIVHACCIYLFCSLQTAACMYCIPMHYVKWMSYTVQGYSRDCKLAPACHSSQLQHNGALSKRLSSR